MVSGRRWLFVASMAVAVALIAAARLAHAGGVNFGEDSDTNDGPSYFGFVRDADGSPVSGARVTASPQAGGSLVTRSNGMGVYKFRVSPRRSIPRRSIFPAPRTAFARQM